MKPAQIEAIIRLNTPPRQPEQWTPVRYINEAKICWFCGVDIPRAHPGTRTGERGTKAWWWKEKDVWECMPCRSTATDAEVARLKGDPGGPQRASESDAQCGACSTQATSTT